MTVLSATIRQNVYSAIRTLLVANKPTYNVTENAIDGEITKTYTIDSEYPRKNPTFPLIVLNSANISPTLITLDGGTNEQGIDVQLDLYAKESDGMKAIDVGMDGVQDMFLTNQSTLKDTNKLVLMEDAFDESNPSNFEEGNQMVNTKSVIVKLKLA